MDSRSKPYIQLHSLVVILAFTAVLGHLIQMPASLLVSWRTGIAALVFFLILRPKCLPDGPAFKRDALITGFILGFHWLTFFGAIKLANITVCLTAMATTSLFTSVTEAIQERRKPRLSEVVLGLIVIPSIILVVGVADTQLLGLLCGILSALLAAIFSVINKTLVRKGTPSAAITQYEMLGAFIVCVAASFALGYPASAYLPAATDWLWILLLSIVCTVYAYDWNIRLLRHFTAFETTLAINFEPVYGILLAAFFFQEHEDMHPYFFVGSALIVLANFAKPTIRFMRRNRRAKPA